MADFYSAVDNFASFEVDGIKILMKIDLYDPGLVKIALNGSFC